MRINNNVIKDNGKIYYIYLSCPYGGDKKNFDKCNEILKKLQPLSYKNNKIVILSPLHMFSSLYNIMSYDEGLSLAMEVLKISNGMIVAPGWQNSSGCRAEIEYCKKHNIPIKYLKEL